MSLAAAALVGRERELEAVERFLDGVAAGAAALLLVGDAGIGKTTIWAEGVARASGRGFRVLTCRPGELETKLAYSAIGDLLEPVAEDLLASLPPPRAQALGQALLIGEAAGPAPDQRAVSLAVLEALRTLAGEGAVLIAIDDLQWLDTSSACVLHFALRRLETEPVAVLTTVRGDSDADPPLFRRSLASERIERLTVGSLDERSLDLLLRAQLGTSFLRPTLVRLHRTSGGNPFFARELARALAERREPVAAGDPLPVPGSLRELIAHRIARLPTELRDTLLIVAALSAPTVELVELALASPASARELLGQSVDAGVIEVDQGRLRFSHPLLASTVYGDASREHRQTLHRHLATVLRDVEERARHLALATDLPDPDVAAVLDEAAQRANARGAPDAAADLAEQALRLTPTEAIETVVTRAMAAADYHFAAGETARSAQLLDDLRRSAPSGPIRARVLRQFAKAAAYERGFASVSSVLEQALAEAADDLPLRAALERDLGLVLINYGHVPDAVEHARRAVGLAERLHNPLLLEEAKINLAGYEFQLGLGVPANLDQLEASLSGDPSDAAERHAPFQLFAMHGLICRKYSDDFAGARRILDRLQEAYVRRHEEGLLPPVLFQLGELECWEGNLAVADRLVAELEETTHRTRQPGAMLSRSLYLRALVDAHLGRVDIARERAMEGYEIADGAGDLTLAIRNVKTLGFLALAVGDFAEAVSRLRRAAELSDAAGYGEPGMFRFAGDLVEALTALAELGEAETRLEELDEQGRRLDRPYALAAAARGRGILLSAQGELAEAVATFEEALTHHERLAMPLELGRTLLSLGVARRRLKHKRLARESLRRALALFEALPAPLWAAKAQAELARIGGRSAPAGLTPTELRVVELVVAGKANKEVAGELYLSVKTVEANLSRVYRKLGVRSRTELAAKLGSGRP